MAEASCPRCDCILERRTTRGIDAGVCSRCHGAWLALDADGLAAALHRCVLTLGGAEASRIGCPVCREKLEARRAGPLELDICAAHGVWFDRDEIARALPLVEEPSSSAAIPAVRAANAPLAAAVPGALNAVEPPNPWIEGFWVLGEILSALF